MLRSYPIVITTFALFVLLLLIWIGMTRYQDFLTYQHGIAEESVNGVANEVARFVREHKRLVKLFTDKHPERIVRLAQNPDSDSLKHELEDEIRKYFPNAFAFTIANKHGEPYLLDFDGRVGDLCISDIKKYAATRHNKPRIHPGIDAYHFDVMASFDLNGEDAVFFVSFHSDLLGNVLRNAQVSGHELMLLLPQKNGLIEVTARGPRNNIMRLDYHLTEQEAGRILYRAPVQGTQWIAAGMHTPGLFSNYRNTLFLQYFLILLLLGVVSSVMFIKLRKEEQRRATAEKAKDEFIAIVSHELRTPLTSIHGALGLIAGGAIEHDPETTRKMIDIAKNNSQQLILLINDLLDLRKIESGAMEYNFSEQDLIPLLQEAIISMHEYGKQHLTEFKLLNHPQQVMARVDTIRFKQVMCNLLSNAAKYGAEVDLVEINVAVHDQQVRISITDHGPGVSEHFRQQIFQKFTQANATDSRHRTGSGLGLSIVKVIIDAHGGKVDYQTDTRQGSTTFYIDLPLCNH